MSERLYHIAERAAWEAARAGRFYEGDTLATEGFVHCSFARQVPGVAAAFFAGRDDLVVLAIDAARLTAELRIEDVAGPGAGDRFPHVYGPIDVDAVVAAVPFDAAAAAAGRWREPT